MEAMFSAEQWAEIDGHIFACHILGAIKSIRSFAGVGVREAIDIHIERYRCLRAEAPGRFACSDEEYWREVYS